MIAPLQKNTSDIMLDACPIEPSFERARTEQPKPLFSVARITREDTNRRSVRYAIGLKIILMGVLVFGVSIGHPASAYEASTTHPGMTSEAALRSQLHTFLKQTAGLPLGLFNTLGLNPSLMETRDYQKLDRAFRRMDPAGRYAPDSQGRQWAIGWLMAGSVLAGMGSDERHHFYSPHLKSGLKNEQRSNEALLQMASVFEGGDTTRQWMTGTGFALKGISALDWMHSRDNADSIEAMRRFLDKAFNAPQPQVKAHYLALSLMAMGNALHLLQDMASPTHVRNDYIHGHLERLGNSFYYRGAAYERYVAEAFGQTHLPLTPLPDNKDTLSKTTLRDFFTSHDRRGLADITSASFFSPGTTPEYPSLSEWLRQKPHAVQAIHSKASMKFPSPAAQPIDLHCLRMNRTCYWTHPSGPLLAYRLNARRELYFFLDRACYKTAAQQLIPMAISYSAAFIDHVLQANGHHNSHYRKK